MEWCVCVLFDCVVDDFCEVLVFLVVLGEFDKGEFWW